MATVGLFKEDLFEIMKKHVAGGYPMIVMHGCNMQGRMGSGFAKLVHEYVPYVYTQYHEALTPDNYEDMPKLGDIVVAQSKGILFINALTQDNYGYDSKRYMNYGALAKACMETNKYLKNNPEILKQFTTSVGCYLYMPKIGCGLGGGDWNIVKEILEQCFDSDISIKVYEK